MSLFGWYGTWHSSCILPRGAPMDKYGEAGWSCHWQLTTQDSRPIRGRQSTGREWGCDKSNQEDSSSEDSRAPSSYKRGWCEGDYTTVPTAGGGSTSSHQLSFSKALFWVLFCEFLTILLSQECQPLMWFPLPCVAKKLCETIPQAHRPRLTVRAGY